MTPGAPGRVRRARPVDLYGHRGAKGEAPENTLPGFAYARRLGVQAFELDVRLTADGELVVIHDETVDRTTSATGHVADLTAAQLAALDARAAFPEWPERAGVPRLEEVLGAFPDLPAWQIEIKPAAPAVLERVAQGLVALLTRHGAAGRTVVSSFDAQALAIVRRLAPDLPRALIGRYDAPSYLATALELGCAGACVPHRSGSAAVVAAAQAHGLQVTGWLGNDPAEVSLLLDWNVDSITSDYPGVALPALRAAGHPR